MSDFEANCAELAEILKKVCGAWADLDTSRRDWGFSGNAADGADRPSSMLCMLMTEQADEARRLYLAAADAADLLRRMRFEYREG